MIGPTRKKPWSKPAVRLLGTADELRSAIDSGERDELASGEQRAISELLGRAQRPAR